MKDAMADEFRGGDDKEGGNIGETAGGDDLVIGK